MGPVIICAIEEATAEAVASTAAELAPALGARVLFLHVERGPALFNASADHEFERHRLARRGDQFLRSVGALLPYGTRVEERVALGAPAGEIVAVAEDVGASLIIVGSRRHAAALRAPTGNVSENVVQRAGCPVVIAPAVARRRQRESGSDSDRSVLVGVGSTEHTLAVVRLGRELAAIFDDRLVLVHASQNGVEPGDTAPPLPSVVREAHESAGPDASLVLAGGPAGYVLDRASDRENARLIVIGSGAREHGTAADDSLARQLSRIARCPIVVMPNDTPLTGIQCANPEGIAIGSAPVGDRSPLGSRRRRRPLPPTRNRLEQARLQAE
jgi:nucleotide-binding universal stress UspA family protein